MCEVRSWGVLVELDSAPLGFSSSDAREIFQRKPNDLQAANRAVSEAEGCCSPRAVLRVVQRREIVPGPKVFCVGVQPHAWSVSSWGRRNEANCDMQERQVCRERKDGGRAGEGNRTLIPSLGSLCSAIELHPQRSTRLAALRREQE